jgi:primosomal protein N'
VRSWLQEDDRRSTRLFGPYPPFFARSGGLYRWQLILRGPQPAAVLRPETRLRQLSEWHIEVNAPSLL